MNDDKSSEVIKRTDLSNEVGTERGSVRFKFGKADFEMRAESSPGTAQNKAQTTLYLAVAIGVIAAVAWAIGIPAVAAMVAGLAATITAYLLVHFTSGLRNPE